MNVISVQATSGISKTRFQVNEPPGSGKVVDEGERERIQAYSHSRRSVENRRNSVDRGTYSQKEVKEALTQLAARTPVADGDIAQVTQALKGVPALAHFADSDLVRIARLAEPQTVGVGASIFTKNARCHGLAILREGGLTITSTTSSSNNNNSDFNAKVSVSLDASVRPAVIGAVVNPWCMDLDGLNRADVFCTSNIPARIWFIPTGDLLQIISGINNGF